MRSVAVVVSLLVAAAAHAQSWPSQVHIAVPHVKAKKIKAFTVGSPKPSNGAGAAHARGAGRQRWGDIIRKRNIRAD